MNWNRLIYCYLPICLRKTGLYALLQVLATPLVSLYGIFQQFRAKMIYQANVNPSVIMLRKVIADETGKEVQIVDALGMPTDFMVRIGSGLSDSEINRIRAVVNKYKEAGKSFYISENVMALSYEFIYDYPTIKSFTIDMIGYCELRPFGVGILDDKPKENAYVVPNNDGLDINVRMSVDVVTELVIQVYDGDFSHPFHYEKPGKTKIQTATFLLTPNNSGHQCGLPIDQGDDEDEAMYGQDPDRNNYYYYISKIKWNTLQVKEIVRYTPQGKPIDNLNREVNVGDTSTRQV
jgi:hypothetical protein